MVEYKSRGLIRRANKRGYILKEELEALNSFENLYKGLSEEYINEMLKFPSSVVRSKFVTFNRDSFEAERFEKFRRFVKLYPKGAIYKEDYWVYLHGLSKGEAQVKIAQYKKDKVTSKEGFIKRHGKEKGLEVFSKFQETSGSSAETKKNQGFNFREATPLCVEYWIKRGFSEQDSVEQVKSFQKENAGVNRSVWLRKGHTEEEVDVILESIHVSKGGSYTVESVVSKEGISYEEATIIVEDRKQRMLDSLVKQGRIVPLERQKEFKDYNLKIRALTEKQDLTNIDNIDKRGQYWHLDHKYSILRGFLDSVTVEVMSSVHNLQCVPKEYNLNKGVNCDISLEELQKLYYNEL